VQRLISNRGARGCAVLVSIALLASCGGGDDDEAADQATTEGAPTEAATTEAPAESATTADDDAAAEITDMATTEEPASSATADATGDDGETIKIDDFDDLPQECRDAFGDFLRQIEPTVEDIEWETATMAEFEALSEQLDTQSSSFDEDMEAAGCNDYEVGESAESVRAMIDFAEDEAPGAVGYLEFLASFMEGLSGDAGAAADVPADCDGAIAYMEDLIAEHGTMSELAMNDMMAVGQVMGVIQSECPADQVSAFFAREDVSAFVS
jgi:hypothetical protein